MMNFYSHTCLVKQKDIFSRLNFQNFHYTEMLPNDIVESKGTIFKYYLFLMFSFLLLSINLSRFLLLGALFTIKVFFIRKNKTSQYSKIEKWK